MSAGKRQPGEAPQQGDRAAAARRLWLVRGFRYALPASVAIGGIVVMSFGGESELEGGAGIVSAGLAIYFVNWIFRLGVSGERERRDEEAAREYYRRHGRWPG